jgi:hypothetical protein
MKKLPVKMLALLDGLQTSERDPIQYYLDVETGEVVDILVPDSFGSGAQDFDDEGREDIEGNPDRYKRVPSVPGRTQYRWMEGFVDSIDESDVAEKLRIALAGRGAFGRFREVLADWTDLQDRWNTVRSESLVQEAVEWLESLGIEAEFELPAQEAPVSSKTPRKKAVRPSLIHILVLGAREDPTEAVDGKVRRVVDAGTPPEARSMFKSLAREWCEMRGVGWRNRFVEGKTEFELEDLTLVVVGTIVEVWVRIPSEALRAFGR